MTNNRQTNNRDLDPPPTAQELAEAAQLRKALDEEELRGDAQLLHSLKMAHAPTELDPKQNKWLVAQALRQARAAHRRRILLGSGATVLAMAASIALVVGLISERQSSPSVADVQWHRSTSTQPLIVAEGLQADPTKRVDRIALTRARDYRHNMFAQMGVR